MTIDLSADEARRLALAAQGFGARLPSKPTIRDVHKVVRHLHVLQLDSVNVLVRAHYLPVFSRLGVYPLAAMDELLNVRHDLVELDAHQASLVPVELEPLFRSRMEHRRRHWMDWRKDMERKRPGYVDEVERTVVQRGPISLKDLEDPGRRPKLKAREISARRRDGEPYAETSILWGRPSDGKDALDGLLAEGRLALAGRRRGFERLYDLAERVVSPEVRAQPMPSESHANLELVRLAARALGVATIKDLAGYFCCKIASTRATVNELTDAGELVVARVEGWPQPAFVLSKTKVPKALEVRALISPFDSLTWSRERTARLFGFDFSFEIYVPAAKRTYGYYVLPFLLGDTIVARVDLKADRQGGSLLVQGAYAEPGQKAKVVVGPLAETLRGMARWLSLDRVEVVERGDLAAPLRRALGIKRQVQSESTVQ